jgi:hypothetical protein
MSANGRFNYITLEHFMAVAGRFGRSTTLQVLRQVGETGSAGPDFEVKAKVSAAEIERIKTRFV